MGIDPSPFPGGVARGGKRGAVIGRRVAAVFATLAAAYLGFGILVAGVKYPGRLSKAEPLPLHVRGVMHVHTKRSDGHETYEEVAASAKEAGLDFVFVTDHNLKHPLPPQYVDGVLMIDGTERSTKQGHRVELGDVSIAAHPLNRKRPYNTLGKEELTGMEVLSGDDIWREALAAPMHGFIQAMLTYPFNAQHAFLQLVKWPEAPIRRWMELAESEPFIGTCAVDAHGYPPYVQEFHALQIHLLTEERLTGDAAADETALLDSLESGHFWCNLEGIVDGAGFSFSETDADGDHPMGSEVKLASKPRLNAQLRLAPLPPGATLSLLRGLDPVESSSTGTLEYAPATPGVYRIEVSLEGRTLFGRPREMKALFSNPIYVR
jgi:hypothetical protein